ncbi:hypothetical protein GALL_417330 [mine drainage metagenome]|uniref:Uncharacterized protein n=1 Tax=mine drainage metagenome TaxID=410659 RepID=A0A1J5QGF9_9ZZZZ
MNAPTISHGSVVPERKFPPIAEISVGILALIVIGGVYLAAHLPKHVSLVPTTALTVAAGVLALANVVLLARIKDFAWKSFFLVAKWTLLGYAVVAGMLEYIFVYDGTRGSTLVLLTSTLAIFAMNLAVLFGFSVAQFQDV